ncbi:MAG: methylamine dehydrogenase light chain [Dehalococcoidia bacterium]
MKDLLDLWTERVARDVARRSSRRAFISRLGAWLAGSAVAPLLLPVERVYASSGESKAPESGDPQSCDYWRYCAQGGPLCSCCGGSYNQCPPGTEQSKLAWIGTCLNPADNKHYLIGYHDCCGKTVCQHCTCYRFEGEMPVYRPGRANDVHWCQANSSPAVACTLAIVLGPADNAT